MTISTPIIAAGSTVTRANAKTVVVRIRSTIPPRTDYQVIDGAVVEINQIPVFEGEMIVYRNPDDGSATMYVAIKDTRGLLWKKVKNWGNVKDPRTGLTKDPNLGFYSILAS